MSFGHGRCPPERSDGTALAQARCSIKKDSLPFAQADASYLGMTKLLTSN